MCVLLGACSGGPSAVEVTAPSPSGQSTAECRHLLDVLPSTVDGHDRRDVEPAKALAAAWGDPPIVLRCGVHKPAGLKPTSRCPTINNVGWFADKHAKKWVFTTIGRSTYVEVTVPKDYAPAADALVDLAGPIKKATSWPHPCQ